MLHPNNKDTLLHNFQRNSLEFWLHGWERFEKRMPVRQIDCGRKVSKMIQGKSGIDYLRLTRVDFNNCGLVRRLGI